MTGEIAADVLNNSLYGDLYQREDETSFKYRMGNLKLDTANGTGWEAFNLTENYREIISLAILKNMNKISKNDLSDEEKDNLEKLLQQPRE